MYGRQRRSATQGAGIVIAILLAVSTIAQGEELDPENLQNPPAEQVKQQRWALFPVVSSSPETGLALGAMVFHFFPTTHQDQTPSTVDMVGFATTEGQYFGLVSPNLYLSKGKLRLATVFSSSLWPANYYGIGRDSPDDAEQYEATIAGAQMVIEGRFPGGVTLAAHGEYRTEEIDAEAGGVLEGADDPGSDDSLYAALGASLGYDTRDNINAPCHGNYTTYSYTHYLPSMGSDFDFHVQALDIRQYFPVRNSSALAIAARLRSTRGDIPFRSMASPDGSTILRGIENGRYRDRDMLAIQTEYRFAIRGPFAATVFAEIAQVDTDLERMRFSAFKSSLGAGFRYALNREQRLNLRADVAWVDDGPGIIINVREAF